MRIPERFSVTCVNGLIALMMLVYLGMLFSCQPAHQTSTPAINADRALSKDTAAASEAKSEVEPTSHEKVPVVYDRRLDPVAITEPQRDHILTVAQKRKPEGARIWYIHVHRNDKDRDSGTYGNFTVFYAPEITTGRVRKGRCISALGLGDKAGKIRDDPIHYWGQDPPGHWMQVSLADRPFGEEAEIPDVPLWPFSVPGGFSDDEVVEIVDFARSAVWPDPDAAHDVDSQQPTYRIRSGEKEPIYRICRGDDDSVEVWFGAMQGLLAGSGTIVTGSVPFFL